MAQELRRLSGDNDYAARITRSERNSHQLERNFAQIGDHKPRVAVTVDLLSTGFDAPDVKNIVFVRPLRSAILYKQMKGRGTRLCEDVNKRYFTIFDYSATSQLEDAEFDGHPANKQKGAGTAKPRMRKASSESEEKPVAEGITVQVSDSRRYVCLADGQRIPFEEYTEQSRELILDASASDLSQLLEQWIDRDSRLELREALRERDIYPAAFRHFLDLPETDEVDILAKIGFDLSRVPTRHERVDRFWTEETSWLETDLGIVIPTDSVTVADTPDNVVALKPRTGTPGAAKVYPMAADEAGGYSDFKHRFWQASLDHYAIFGVDELESANTYRTPQFADQFGSFQTIAREYGGPQKLRQDLEAVKHHL